MTVFYSMYVSLCAEKNMSLSAVAEAVGLSRTAPNGWKKGKQPSDVTLQKLSKYFDVDVSVFSGEKENPMFYANYVKLCNSIGKTPSAVAIEIGISKSIVSRWKNGGGVTDANIQKVADYFKIPTEELTREIKKDPSTKGEVSPAKRKLFDMIDNMSDDECQWLFELIAAAKKL